jgi:hypothetical protein
VRGSKPFDVLPYAKWQRILKNLESFDQAVVASYNLYYGIYFEIFTNKRQS